MKPTHEAISALTNQIMKDVSTLRLSAPIEAEEALVSVETFISVALRVFAKTNPSKLRDVIRTVEVQSLIDGKRNETI